uniref:Selenoprotein P2 n=1 Tax=Amphilophus citrinellus TaxID=61819 RepID=A0A3Q0R7W6_AMPCI
MRSLLTLWLFAALPDLLWASHTTLIVEGDNDASRICKPAPNWDIKGHAPMKDLLGNVAVVALYSALYHLFHLFTCRIGGLRDKLNRNNLTDVSFIIVNEREPHSRAMYWALKRSAPHGVPVYQQEPLQNDVWEALDGDKDDFLIYDRCGLLTFHTVMPYSFLHYRFVEAAITATYLKNICNCTNNSTSSAGANDITKNGTAQPDDGDDSEVGDAASGGTHQHSHHHHRHLPNHPHHHDQHSSHQNQSLHQQDTNQNNSPHHHHQPHHNHHGNGSD